MAMRLPSRAHIRQLHQVSSLRPSQQLCGSLQSRLSSTKASQTLEDFLGEPSWSVRSLLPPDEQQSSAPEISAKQLHHLLRLSALPMPKDQEEEQKMLKTLGSQLRFVKDIQRVDTTGVVPLQAIRDETAAAEKESTITMDTLKDALAKEDVIGKHHKRIKRRREPPADAKNAEDWGVLGHASRKSGRFFVVDSSKE